ncbi:nuclear transport factor 2 family protein [Demequina globuliformis]|uniref:nuclear transport factor 2 family protein n=1 Tax=Demequina globuliformis TaxID=676202 RepID=UPI000783AC5C|nr:nuclear transport factor 2 family protein [Demequina globuliformis]
MMELAHDEALTLQAMEEAMWRADTRFDARYMDAVLAENFHEVGQSGRTYTREDTLALRGIEIDITFPLRDFSAVAICEDVALVTYTAVPERGRGVSHRSSVWVNDGRWKLRFHQATPTDA